MGSKIFIVTMEKFHPSHKFHKMDSSYFANITVLCIMQIFLLTLAIQCPTGMVYQQCGSLCIQTCTNNITSACNDGCAEGCFCPDGQVLSNGKCVHPIACPGL